MLIQAAQDAVSQWMFVAAGGESEGTDRNPLQSAVAAGMATGLHDAPPQITDLPLPRRDCARREAHDEDARQRLEIRDEEPGIGDREGAGNLPEDYLPNTSLAIVASCILEVPS